VVCFYEQVIEPSVSIKAWQYEQLNSKKVFSIKVTTRCTFYMYFYSSLFLAVHVLGAIVPILRSTTAALSHRCV
jgi:hypothetical protein